MPETVPRARLSRSREDRLVAGVAAGIAANVRLSPTVVRALFVLLVPVNGLGVLLYAAFWAVMPSAEGQQTKRREWYRLLPFVLAALGLMAAAGLFNREDPFSMTVGWLVALIAIGAGIIWHQTQSSTTAPWFSVLTETKNRRTYLIRFLAGGVLVVAGVIGLLVVYSPLSGVTWSELWQALAFALVALAGVGLVAAPLLWRTLAALRSEREGRIREQERAELAAMVHDQVLHTLALIQRNAADPATVVRIARGQERSLRNWLYQPTGSPNEHFAAALEQAAVEVEDTYGIAVEVVVVGDRAFDDKVAALVAAAREAMVNAARHAGVKTISLYAEAEPGQLSVFVRDRGAGFDLDSLDGEHRENLRHGVKGSIVGRMTRHGGEAEIRTAPGEGTEVRLILPVPLVKEESGRD
ncbi:histidine kinase [Rhizocola hellebori]|uniref:Histidine kinase n=1 Tax=Rhizocola hellebori TaxID=1392758 RepID=A0A8J3Q5X8_9ACTN|nr:ATP-binding protein [Rhizocola hellebori]GIH04396.1 histidine kinase [Rhizocola hellebori]